VTVYLPLILDVSTASHIRQNHLTHGHCCQWLSGVRTIAQCLFGVTAQLEKNSGIHISEAKTNPAVEIHWNNP